METFKMNSQTVMEHIKNASHSSSLYCLHHSCFMQFGAYLAENGLAYSADIARSWLGSQSRSKETLQTYAKALQRLDDVYVYGSIRFIHQMRMPLMQGLDEMVQAYLCDISGTYSVSHLTNIETRCRCFLRFLQQQQGLTSVRDLSYHDILDFCREPLETLSKEDHCMYKGSVMRFLEWLSKKQFCPVGFSMLLFQDRAKKTVLFSTMPEPAKKILSELKNYSYEDLFPSR